jgi:hypothetical protein
MRRKASHPAPHRFVDLCSCFLTARNGETMLLVRQRSPGVPHLPVSTARAWFRESCSENHALQPVRWLPAQPVQGAGEEAAMPGQPAPFQVFPDVPWQFTLENCQFATGVTASSCNKFESSHVFADPLWGRMLRTATKKHFNLVQKLWTKIVPCGSLRKSKNETTFARRNPSDSIANTIDQISRCWHLIAVLPHL